MALGHPRTRRQTDSSNCTQRIIRAENREEEKERKGKMKLEEEHVGDMVKISLYKHLYILCKYFIHCIDT